MEPSHTPKTMGYLDVLRRPAFALYFSGALVDTFGNNIFLMTVLWFIFKITGSHVSLSGIIAVSIAPTIFFAPLAGTIVDRWDRRRIALVLILLNAAIVLCGVLFCKLNLLGVTLLFTLCILISISNVFFNLSVLSLLPEIVPEEGLVAANALVGSSLQTGRIIGSGLAGFILEYLPIEGVFLIDASTYIVGALCLFFMLRFPLVSSRKTDVEARVEPWKDFTACINYIKATPMIFGISVIFVLPQLTEYLLCVLQVPYVSEVLKQGPLALGMIDAVFGTGAIVGALVLVALMRFWGENVFFWIGPIGMGTGYLFFALAGGLFEAVSAGFLVGLSGSVTHIFYITSIQRQVNNNFLGRFLSFLDWSNAILTLSLVLGMGGLVKFYNTRASFVILSVLLFAGAGLGVRVAMRMRTLPLANDQIESR